MMMTDTHLLLSVEEAADQLPLGRTRTYELVKTRKIQSVKVGRRRLVVRSSLLDFVQALLVEQDCASY